MRVLVPGALTLLVLLIAVSVEDYRIYHGAEMVILAIWFGSLNALSLRLSALVALAAVLLFIAVAYIFGEISGLKLHGLLALMLARAVQIFFFGSCDAPGH